MARRSWTHDRARRRRPGGRSPGARRVDLPRREPRPAGARRSCGSSTRRPGSAFAIGVTGPPGVGKSSLIGALVRHVRALGLSVGVISVDPSSPFTQGRCSATGSASSTTSSIPACSSARWARAAHLGGLAEATLQSLLLLDAAGKDVVFLETVGTGQSEVEVMGIADEVVLVLMPGSGDSVQALKAGIMEIPDVIAINKMDQPGAKAMMSDIRRCCRSTPMPSADRRSCSPRRCGARASSALGRARRTPRPARGGRRARRAPAPEPRGRGRLRRDGAGARAGIERRSRTIRRLRELVAAVQRRELDPLTAVDRDRHDAAPSRGAP